jgi:hypothetical protein
MTVEWQMCSARHPDGVGLCTREYDHNPPHICGYSNPQKRWWGTWSGTWPELPSEPNWWTPARQRLAALVLACITALAVFALIRMPPI